MLCLGGFLKARRGSENRSKKSALILEQKVERLVLIPGSGRVFIPGNETGPCKGWFPHRRTFLSLYCFFYATNLMTALIRDVYTCTGSVPFQDSQLVIEAFKSGFEPPGDIDFEDYTQPMKRTVSESSLSNSRGDGKSEPKFGGKSKGKLWPFIKKNKVLTCKLEFGASMCIVNNLCLV